MPASPKTICPAPGCNRLTEGGRCPEHKAQQHKGTSKNRTGDPFYKTKRWQQTSKSKLTANPYCECDDCRRTGGIVPASVVDHYLPRATHPELSWDWDNFRSMSESHHNRKTAKERANVQH